MESLKSADNKTVVDYTEQIRNLTKDIQNT